MKRIIFISLIIAHCALNIAQAQVRQDRSIIRGNVTSITVKYPGDITADSLFFQVRTNSSYTSTKHIEKENTVAGGSDAEILATYAYPYTTVKVFFSTANTSGLTIANYYYDLRKSVSPDSAVLVYGTFKIQSYAGENVNNLAGTGGGLSESSVKSWIGDTANVVRLELADYLLEADTMSLSNRIDAIDLIAADSTDVQGMISDTATVLRSEFVDKSSTQTITGAKTLNDSLVINSGAEIVIKDTTAQSILFYNPFTAPYGFYGLQSWNIWGVNSDGRPDVGLSLSYNTGAGAAIIDTDDIGIGLMMESHYDGNGYPAAELHLMYSETNGTQHRFLTSAFNKTTSKAFLGFNADYIYFANDSGAIYEYKTLANTAFYQPHYSLHPNNTPISANWDADSSAWLYLPYIDNNDRYTFGSIDTVIAGSQFLHFYQTGLRFDNTFGISSYNSGGTLTKNFYYDSDELRIQADTTEPIKLRASNLYFENSEGGLTDIINPALPFDTTGLEAGQKYVDLNTGLVSMRIGENLISNGDFSSWTWDATSFRHPTGWIKQYIGDTTQTYIENVGNQLHIVSDGSARLLYYYNASTLEIGETYVYAFNLISYTADSLVFNLGGVPINPNYTNLTAGYKTGEITATGVAMFGFDCQIASADVTIDNLRIWKKTGGNIQQTYTLHQTPITINGVTVTDTVFIGRMETGAVFDSIRVFDVVDSIAIQLFYRNPTDNDLITTVDTLTTDTTIAFDTTTIPAGAKVYMYPVYVGDSEAYLRSELYWRN